MKPLFVKSHSKFCGTALFDFRLLCLVEVKRAAYNGNCCLAIESISVHIHPTSLTDERVTETSQPRP